MPESEMQKELTIPARGGRTAARVVAKLQRAGFTAYWAGGCVRDLLLGRRPKDYDVATDAVPEQVLRIFPGSSLVGVSFGVVSVRLRGQAFEIATFRQDRGYSDGRRPDAVTFSDPRSDAERRDFTVNALFYDPATGRIHDFVNGRADLAAKLIRCVGDPDKRFSEDYLRMLRAVRFATTLGFDLEAATRSAIARHAASAVAIAPERVGQELARLLLESRDPGEALLTLEQVGLLQVLLPEVAAMRHQDQPPAFHPEGDVLKHTALMFNKLPRRRDLSLVLGILLHDVGKPATTQHGPDRVRFPRHAEVGANMAAAILERLRFSSKVVGEVRHIVGNHMRFTDTPSMRRSTLRRLVGHPVFDTELAVHRLDCLASHGDLSNYRFLKKFRRELAAEPVMPEPWVSGHDLLAMDVPHGPEVGRWKRLAYDAQLEDRFASRDELVGWLRAEVARSTK
jgi:poly(A) polymerase